MPSCAAAAPIPATKGRQTNANANANFNAFSSPGGPVSGPSAGTLDPGQRPVKARICDRVATDDAAQHRLPRTRLKLWSGLKNGEHNENSGNRIWRHDRQETGRAPGPGQDAGR